MMGRQKHVFKEDAQEGDGTLTLNEVLEAGLSADQDLRYDVRTHTRCTLTGFISKQKQKQNV